MNCREARRWLSPYLDSELGKTKTFEVSEHLRHCPDCTLRFDREREVDRVFADRLGGTPSLDWDAIGRKATASRGILRRWRVGALGMAACIAAISWGAIPSGEATASGVENWIVTRFGEAAADSRPFEQTSGAAPDLSSAAQATLGVSLAMRSTSAAGVGHHFKLIDVRERTTDDNVPYLEIRLNCCGKPILLVVAKKQDASRLGTLPEGADSGAVVHEHDESGLHVGTWFAGNVVMVVASPHEVDDLALSLYTS